MDDRMPSVQIAFNIVDKFFIIWNKNITTQA